MAVVRAPGDGYTLLLADSANAINATLYDKLNFNFIRDMAPVASIMTVPLVFEVNPSVPAKSVPEFVAYAKANSGKVNMASAGSGHSTHLAGELRSRRNLSIQSRRSVLKRILGSVPYASGGIASSCSSLGASVSTNAANFGFMAAPVCELPRTEAPATSLSDYFCIRAVAKVVAT